MDQNRQAELEARYVNTLTEFVLRARRVEAHSLAQDTELLSKLSRQEWKIQIIPATGKAFIIQEFPPEEQLESAAARVRPLILEDEATHHAKVIQALKYFTREKTDAGLREAIEHVKGSWAKIKPKGKLHLGHYVQIENPDGERSEFKSDMELGFAWIYGDVVHHDAERRALTEMFGVSERFKAAAPLVAHIMTLTLSTLNLTRRVAALGYIDVPDEVFKQDVVVTETTTRNETAAFFADAGTEITDVLPSEGAEGWTELSSETLKQLFSDGTETQ